MRALVVALLLTACSPAAPALRQDREYSIEPTTRGLTVSGTAGMEVGFGRDFTGAVAALTKVLGPPNSMSNGPACTIVLWRTGLQTHFTGQSFTGWRIEDQQAGTTCPA